MVDTVLQVKDAVGNNKNLRARDDDALGLSPYHADPDRTALLNAIALISTALSGTLNINATTLPLPNGAASQLTLGAILTALQSSLAVTGPLTNSQLIAANLATATGQASLLAALQPATSHVEVTPSNTVDIPGGPSRRIFIGNPGTLVLTVGGTDVSYTVTAGQQLDIVATRIKSSGTTASNIVVQR